MSKFMFHIQFSDQGRFLHEHEVYEMMRSRSLYQVQFDLKHKLHKRLRSLEQAEKMQISSFQKQRNVFLTKMQEKVVQRNKMTDEKSPPLMINGVKRHIQAKDKHVPMVNNENNVIHKHAKSAPSRIVSEESPRTRVVTKETPNTRLVSKETTLSSVQEVTPESEDIKPVSAKIELSYRGRSLQGCKSGYRRSKTMFSDDVTYIDTSSFMSREQAGDLPVNDEMDTTSKPLLLRENTKSQTPKTPRKPSKVGLPNIHGPLSRGNSAFVEQEDNISEISDTAFHRLAGKYNKSKSLTSLSMPVPTPDLKSLSTYEMGMTTPEGQLILSREEYEDYLNRFREAKSKRLKLVRRQSENLDQKVKHFRALRKH